MTALVTTLTIAAVACSTKPLPPPPRDAFREGSGRPVVMIGGGVYGAAMFAPHARDLARDYDVIRIQTLNVQQAERGGVVPPDYSISAEAAAVHETLLSLGVTGPVDVVGSSFGAVVALRLATLYEGRVRSLVLFEPPSFWVLPPEEFEKDSALRSMLEISSRMSGAAEPSDDDLYRFRCILGTCPAAIPHPSDPERTAWDRSRMAMRGLAAVAMHREEPDAIQQLDVPVLLINGRDTVGFPQAHQRAAVGSAAERRRRRDSGDSRSVQKVADGVPRNHPRVPRPGQMMDVVGGLTDRRPVSAAAAELPRAALAEMVRGFGTRNRRAAEREAR